MGTVQVTAVIVIIIAAIVAIAAASVIFFMLGQNRQKKIFNEKVGSAEQKSREIIDEALKTAENTKREALLEVKEESLRQKNELDKEIRDRRNEIQKSERRISNKEEALDQIANFFRLGVRMMHLTYNRRNLIGDGCAESADAGLSDFGRAVIEEMNRLGVIPDVAHSGQRTSLEAALCSKKPVVASHTVAGKLSPHYRGKNGEVIEAICRSGGYVGICGIPKFLQGTADIRALLDHIEYVARTFGVEHVAIGTDRSANLSPAVTERTMPPARAIWESYWSPSKCDDFKETKEQFDSLSWSNWPLFTVGLVQRGFSDDDIRKIIGGNVLRVAVETLG